MAYDKPTPDDFTTRFPIFEDQDGDRIQMFLDEAANTIDTSWREVDYAPAIMYLAAHLLAVDNSDSGAEVEIGGVSVVSSESFAGMSVSYSNPAQQGGVNVSQYGTTAYGRRYYDLLKKNKPSATVA